MILLDEDGLKALAKNETHFVSEIQNGQAANGLMLKLLAELLEKFQAYQKTQYQKTYLPAIQNAAKAKGDNGAAMSVAQAKLKAFDSDMQVAQSSLQSGIEMGQQQGQSESQSIQSDLSLVRDSIGAIKEMNGQLNKGL